MKQFTKVMLPTLGVAVLAAALLSVPAPPVDAQRVAPVTVTNTPLPTTVTNTPSVTISGRPAVRVGNTTATPLFVQNVDDPVRQPFARDCVINTFSSSGLGSCAFGAVPAGKRWVIETMSGQVVVDTGKRPFSINLQLCSAGYATDNYFPAVFQGTSAFYTGDYFTVNQQVRLYADSTGGCSGAPSFGIGISDTTSGSAELTLSGYLVDLP